MLRDSSSPSVSAGPARPAFRSAHPAHWPRAGRGWAAWLILLWLCASPAAGAARPSAQLQGAEGTAEEPDAALAVARRLQDALLSVAGEESSGDADFAERAGKLRPAIEDTVDLEYAVRVVLESLGEQPPGTLLTPERETALRTRMAALLAAEWAAGLEGRGCDRSGECRSSELAGGGRSIVGSLAKGDADEVELEFRVHPSEGRSSGDAWRIRSVRLDGAQVLETLGTDLARQLPAGDLEALEAELERRALRFEASASRVVAEFQGALIDMMKRAQELGYAGRYERMRVAVSETHNLSAMTKLSLSRSWRDLAPEDRMRLIGGFEELSFAAYASNFDGYNGERFDVAEARPVRNGVYVKSTLTKQDGGLVHFDYLLHRRRGQWLIVNITVDGVSDLALKRVEFGKLIEKEGVAGVLAELSRQIAAYERGS